MDAEILDVVTDWATRSVSDGVGGLYDLVDAAFSGAVTDGTAWAFFLNGRVVGVFDGDVDDFDDTPLTAYTAPDISLPLLFAMQARGGETRGQYYSNETPLTELDDTLSSGNFVGYVELSENVLSGDYYVVYYGERSLPVAFVGNEPRLLTGEEAFERAADEVGIFSVVDAEVNVADLPDRPGPAPAEEASGDPVAVGGGAVDDGDGPDTGPKKEDEADSASVEDGEVDPTAVDDGTDDGGVGVARADDAPAGVVSADAASDGTDAEGSATDLDVAMGSGTDADATPATDTEESDSEPMGPEATDSTTDPADPAASMDADGETEADADTPGSAAVGDPPSADADDRLRRELDEAREALAAAEAERDEYREEAARLRDRITELESASADADAPERTLDPDEALSGTNLFVRYEDKSGPTVERAANGNVPREELRANLRIDHHTEFDTAGVRVDEQPFEAFLRRTTEHRFVEWLLTELLYELKQVGGRSEVSKLSDALDRIDRIDLDGEVAVGGAEAATADADPVSFDVVCRDKMGAPLLVADFSDSRDPTRAPTIESILERATSTGRSESALAAAAVVTTSFFDADAMEVAVDATRGGLFSRSSRRSYVKLSRKHGFHLCLIEARDEDFFLTVPDL